MKQDDQHWLTICKQGTDDGAVPIDKVLQAKLQAEGRLELQQ